MEFKYTYACSGRESYISNTKSKTKLFSNKNKNFSLIEIHVRRFLVLSLIVVHGCSIVVGMDAGYFILVSLLFSAISISISNIITLVSIRAVNDSNCLPVTDANSHNQFSNLLDRHCGNAMYDFCGYIVCMKLIHKLFDMCKSSMP